MAVGPRAIGVQVAYRVVGPVLAGVLPVRLFVVFALFELQRARRVAWLLLLDVLDFVVPLAFLLVAAKGPVLLAAEQPLVAVVDPRLVALAWPLLLTVLVRLGDPLERHLLAVQARQPRIRDGLFAA